MSQPARPVRQALQRPVLSPDGNFVAVIVPELEIHIFSVTNYHWENRYFKRIVLSKSTKSFLSDATTLRWSPELVSTGLKLDTTKGLSPGDLDLTWLLLCNGDRIMALSIDLQSPQAHGSNIDDAAAEDPKILADCQFGSQHGKATLIDFVLSHHFALVLFETSTHASIISLDRPQRNEIMNMKYSDSRSFAKSSDNRSFALLLRSKGQDQVAVFSENEGDLDNVSMFSPQTSDAQGIIWSPNGDPVILAWDAASYGVKVVFFTAMGHHLKHLDLTRLGGSSFQAIGIVAMKWYAVGKSTVLATADGHKNVMIRRQEHRTMQVQSLTRFVHPEILDGSQYFLWQESPEGPRTFFRQTIAFESDQHETTGDVDALVVNSNGNLICSKISSHPKCVWIWRADSNQPDCVIILRETVRQILWHPALSHILLIITAQKDARVYLWHDSTEAPEIRELPIPNSRLGKWEGTWLGNKSDDQCGFMMSSPTAFEIGILEVRDNNVAFESFQQRDLPVDDDTEDMSEIITPSRPGRNIFF